jgi:CDK-activating kinase assembly factor MAT1
MSIAFNLINEIDLPQTEARINAYRAENAALIELNIQREEAYAQALKDQEDAERKDREQRAMELRREEEEEKEEREKGRREIIDKLETSDKNAAKVIAKSRANALKRSTARSSTTVSQSNASLLRARAGRSAAIPDVPHVPLQDDWYAYEDKFTLRNGGYNDFMSEAVRKDREGIMRGGGYKVEEAWERALRSAVAALDLPPLPSLDTVHLPALDSSRDVTMVSG